MDVALQLFGKPYVKIDQQTIEISLKKSEAMLYYIAYEKRVTRDELVSIIWCDVEQPVAKKNLRNNLYRLKKDLGIELFRRAHRRIALTPAGAVARAAEALTRDAGDQLRTQSTK